MPDSGGPYLQAALICEKVLREQDGVLSAIRIIDRWSVSAGPGAPESLPTVTFNGSLLLIFKSGRSRGRHTIRIEVEDPSGVAQPTAELPALFEGEDRGVSFVVNLVFQVEVEGLYWFRVFVDDDFATRVPLRVLYLRVGPGPALDVPR